ncbi:MAG: hypothetical protein V7724_05220 [Sediminicola sp.]|tara:strand:- start:14074 stop:14217 length:144 start_codon:yes stop_codon:yes gene_type:complete
MNNRKPLNQYARVGQVRKKEGTPDAFMDNFILGMTEQTFHLDKESDK